MYHAVGQTPRGAFSHNGAVRRSTRVGPDRLRQVSSRFVRNGGDGTTGGDQDGGACRDRMKQLLRAKGFSEKTAEFGAAVAASFNNRLTSVATDLSSIKGNTTVMVWVAVMLVKLLSADPNSLAGQFVHKFFP